MKMRFEAKCNINRFVFPFYVEWCAKDWTYLPPTKTLKIGFLWWQLQWAFHNREKSKQQSIIPKGQKCPKCRYFVGCECFDGADCDMYKEDRKVKKGTDDKA